MREPYRAKILNRGIRTHTRRQCHGQKCCLHNPSKHHMRDWPIQIRMDRHTLSERVCDHGVGHPDPDSLQYLDPKGELALGVHGCDGCCDPDSKPKQLFKVTLENDEKPKGVI